MPDFDVRRLTAIDASAFKALRLRALWEHPEAFSSSYAEDEQVPIEAVERRLDRSSATFFGAFVDDELVGIVGLQREIRLKSRHKATLIAMFVGEEYWGRGIGPALIQAVIDQARDERLEMLVLTAMETNVPILDLYKQAGFQAFGVEPRAIKVDDRAYNKIHMVLDLTTLP